MRSEKPDLQSIASRGTLAKRCREHRTPDFRANSGCRSQWNLRASPTA
jgi:hypothetical protein